jgi:hypothetical protein
VLQWFATQILPKAETTAVSTITSAVVIGCIVAPFRKLWKKIYRALDSVDPDTDSGITKQLSQLQQQGHHIAIRDHDRDDDAPVIAPHRGK